MSELEDEIRLMARIEVEAARREIEWIARRLEGMRKDRKALDEREAQLLVEREQALARMKHGQDALKP